MYPAYKLSDLKAKKLLELQRIAFDLTLSPEAIRQHGKLSARQPWIKAILEAQPQPVASTTCKDCPYFEQFQGEQRGYCCLLEQVAKPHWARTNNCENTARDLNPAQVNTIEAEAEEVAFVMQLEAQLERDYEQSTEQEAFNNTQVLQEKTVLTADLTTPALTQPDDLLIEWISLTDGIVHDLNNGIKQAFNVDSIIAGVAHPYATKIQAQLAPLYTVAKRQMWAKVQSMALSLNCYISCPSWGGFEVEVTHQPTLVQLGALKQCKLTNNWHIMPANGKPEKALSSEDALQQLMEKAGFSLLACTK